MLREIASIEEMVERRVKSVKAVGNYREDIFAKGIKKKLVVLEGVGSSEVGSRTEK